MRNFDSYYDPPEYEYESELEWLDGEQDFSDRADNLIMALVDIKCDMRDALIEHCGLELGVAEDIVEEWWAAKL